MRSERVRRNAGRNLYWDGFFNVRDLGGLPTTTGRLTRSGAFIRSGDLRFVTDAGWQMAYEAGVRTIIDLRNEDEIRPSTRQQLTSQAGSAALPAAPAAAAPASFVTTEVPIDDVADVRFWRYLNGERLNGTPLYFRPFLQRKRERCTAVITALASTTQGGVIFHCGAGRDRTGLVTLLLLALVGVEPEAIADDYALSTDAVRGLFAAVGREDEGPAIEAELTRRGTTTRGAILAVLDGFDARQYLLGAGVRPADLSALVNRLTG
jgi:protein-tyrosine phosphatase